MNYLHKMSSIIITMNAYDYVSVHFCLKQKLIDMIKLCNSTHLKFIASSILPADWSSKRVEIFAVAISDVSCICWMPVPCVSNSWHCSWHCSGCWTIISHWHVGCCWICAEKIVQATSCVHNHFYFFWFKCYGLAKNPKPLAHNPECTFHHTSCSAEPVVEDSFVCC